MPCDSIQTMTVENELANRDVNLLAAALAAMGFVVNRKAGGYLTFYGVNKATGLYHTGTYGNGKFQEQIQAGKQPLEINAVKRAYSAQIIAKGFPGWKVTKTTPVQQEVIQ
jgi:hypothetical protein